MTSFWDNKPVLIAGPTASGKSDVAAAIAELIPADVVSADAMQVYDGLPILTNRSPHPERLVGIWPLSHVASVGEYAPLAHDAVDEMLAAGTTPLVLGGDHSVALGTLGGLASTAGPGGVLWIDAHSDINTPETSPRSTVTLRLDRRMERMGTAMSLGLSAAVATW